MIIKPKKRQAVHHEVDQSLTVSGEDEPATQTEPSPIRGLGDVVAKVAQPIAKVIDKIAKTNIQGCGGCARRQEYLNKKFPSDTPQ